jgi:hypothetical protein
LLKQLWLKVLLMMFIWAALLSAAYLLGFLG